MGIVALEADDAIPYNTARRILKEAVSAPERLGDLALRFFGPRHGVDLELPERAPHVPIDLSE